MGFCGGFAAHGPAAAAGAANAPGCGFAVTHL
jgi:hypothetical protein